MRQLPISEHEIQSAILELLWRSGYVAWRNNVGAQRFQGANGSARWIRFGQKGHSDIFGIQPGTGKFVAIECKVDEKQKPTAEQEEFIRKVNATGGIALIAWDVNQVAQRLNIKGLF